MRAHATRRMREIVDWTMLSVVVTASRIAMWLDDVTVTDRPTDHAERVP